MIVESSNSCVNFYTQHMRPFMAWPQPEFPVLFPITPWARSQAFFALGHTPLFQDPEPLHMPISSFLLPLMQQTKHLLYAEIMQVITTQFDKSSNQQTLLQYPAGIQNGRRTLSFWGARGREQGEESWRFHIGTDLWAESSMIRNLPVKEGGGNFQMVFDSSVSPHSDIKSWHQSCIQRVSYICVLLLLLPLSESHRPHLGYCHSPMASHSSPHFSNYQSTVSAAARVSSHTANLKVAFPYSKLNYRIVLMPYSDVQGPLLAGHSLSVLPPL